MADVSNPLDQSGADAAAVSPAKPIVTTPAATQAKAVEAPEKAVAGAPAAEQSKPKKKPKPVGVVVHERTVLVDGKLVAMAERHQTPLASGQEVVKPAK